VRLIEMALWQTLNFTEIARAFWKYQLGKIGESVNHSVDFDTCRLGWQLNKKELEKFFAQYKLQYINHGRSRATCAVDGKWIVKFPIGMFGLMSNEKEFKSFRNIADEKRKYFTRILKVGKKFEYILAERVTPNDDARADIPREVKRQIIDAAHFNFGTRADGSWVILDYAEDLN
jgi:RNA recognition motif-containing protein